MIGIFAENDTQYTAPLYQLQPMSCELTQELNGAWTLTLENSTADDRYKAIVKNAVLTVPTPQGQQMYRIYDTVKSNYSVIAYAQPIFIDSANEVMLIDRRPTNCTGQQALDILTANTKYSATTDILDVHTAYYVRKNLIEALNGEDDNSFVKLWGGEVIYNNYQVKINKNAGKDRGLRVAFGFNMQGISEEINTSEMATRIIPVSFNGHTLDGATPWVDSPIINNYPIIYTKVVTYSDLKLAEDNNGDGYASLSDLRLAMRERCQKEYENGIDLPSITYYVDMVDLASTAEYKDFKNLVKVSLGDTLKCENKHLNIATTAKVTGITYDCINSMVTAVILGSNPASYFDKLTSTTSSTLPLINTDGTLKGESIAGVVNLMQAKLKAARNSGEKQSSTAILFEDNDEDSDTYGALAIGTTGFMISDFKDDDGEWIWKTYGTGQGFYADCIIAGVLYSQNYQQGVQGFKADLNTGKFEANNFEIEGQNIGAYVANTVDEEINKEVDIELVKHTPSLENEPASLWHEMLLPASDLFPTAEWKYTDEEYSKHIGTVAFDAVTGNCYIFKHSEEQGFYWKQQPKNSLTYTLNSLSQLTVAEGEINTKVERMGVDLRDNYWTAVQTESEIKQTADSITSTVSATYATLEGEEVLKSEIRQTAEAVTTKVSKGNVSSEISQESDLISISSDRLEIYSTYTSLTQTGHLETADIAITGGNIDLTSYDGTAIKIANTTGHKALIDAFQIDMEYGNRESYFNYSGFYSDNGTVSCKNLTVTGSKNRVVDGKEYGYLGFNAFETLGAFFADIGSAEIKDGSVYVMFDDRLSVTTEAEYYILTTVTEGHIDRIEKHQGYFIAYGEGSFDWMMCAKQKGYGEVYGHTEYTPSLSINKTSDEDELDRLTIDYEQEYYDILLKQEKETSYD